MVVVVVLQKWRCLKFCGFSLLLFRLYKTFAHNGFSVRDNADNDEWVKNRREANISSSKTSLSLWLSKSCSSITIHLQYITRIANNFCLLMVSCTCLSQSSDVLNLMIVWLGARLCCQPKSGCWTCWLRKFRKISISNRRMMVNGDVAGGQYDDDCIIIEDTFENIKRRADDGLGRVWGNSLVL